jgi:glycosyltransferase involved in cell wall biosynthesis
MIIGIDALGIEKASGGRTATLNLLRPLFKLDQTNQYIVLVSTYEPLLTGPGNNIKQIVLPIKNRFLKRIYAQIAFPYIMRHCDIVHFTKNLSLWGPLPPKIVTIFDLSMLKLPHLMPKSDYIYWKTIQRWSLQTAKCIIAISQSAANDINRYYEIPLERIRVIYPAIAPHFYQRTFNEISIIRKKYNLPDDYILHVGRIDPIKNIGVLIRAFNKLRKNELYSGKLVIVGEFYKKAPDTSLLPLIQELQLEKEVIFTGYIPDEDLPAIFSGARLNVFPSHNEGFGLVALEAMACGVPVIANQAGGALKEVIGDAGIVTESNDLDTIYSAIRQVIINVDYQNELRTKGLDRAKSFNWEETARQTLNVYTQIVNELSYE